jgi:hypothetical protein
MIDFCKIYKSQYKKAKEILDLLKEQRNQIDFKLQSNSSCAILHKELRDINLDIRITENEIEHAESVIIRHNQSSVI